MIKGAAEHPLFSVIIPTYNRLPLLQKAVSSVRQQSFTDFETIIVDDGSSDRTWKYVCDLRPKVELLRQENLGPGAARNLGAKRATGKYLAFLDSDDMWFPWTLDVYQKVIKETNYPKFMAGKPYRFSSNPTMPSQKEIPEWEYFSDYLDSWEEWRWWGVSSFIIQRGSFLQTGGFLSEIRTAEDADLALRLGIERGFVQITRPYTFAYREHQNNLSQNKCGDWCSLKREIAAEFSGEYPGGRQRCWQRREILCRHIRPVALACARQHMERRAWELYWSTLMWHIRLGRWRFLLAFPAVALWARLRGNATRG